MKTNKWIGRGAMALRFLPALPIMLLMGSVAHADSESGRSSIQAIAVPTPPVNLGVAGDFAILSKSGITDVPASAVKGNVGTSPISGAADHLTCPEVTGKIYSVDAAGPAPCNIKAPAKLTSAIGDMQTAYTDAAGRPATKTELGAGSIGGLTLAPGVYSWSTNVTIPTDVVLKGSLNDVWIFQISKNLLVANGKAVLLHGHARARNVFWQVAGKTVLGTTSRFEGIVLCKTLIAVKTDATVNGRLLGQTAVTLQMDTVNVR
jgi:hypothetical protein